MRVFSSIGGRVQSSPAHAADRERPYKNKSSPNTCYSVTPHANFQDLRMELTPTDSSLYNADLAPIPAEKRSWGTYNYASLWVARSVCIPTYMLASGLIAGGMSWIQAVLTILLGNLIVLIPMLLNAHAGTRYGIPFPVFVRASFGVRGANVPAVLRALVACGWFGIQAWIGGQAIYSMLSILAPGLAANSYGPWL